MPTILVIEDEPAIAELFQELLEDEGYHVVLAYNGQEGLDALQQVIPELVFCDVMMPMMSGWEFLDAFRALPEFADVPIVMMSAAPSIPIKYEELYTTFLPKPLNFNDLLDLVEELLE